MSKVIDANVFKAYYHLLFNKPLVDLTGDPTHLFASTYQIYFDDSNHIKNEWEALVEREWFNSWLVEQIQNDKIRVIPIKDNCRDLKRRLEKDCGFPKSADFWYIKTTKSSLEYANNSILVSEDIDFFDPTKKRSVSGAARKQLLEKTNNPIQRMCARESIVIRCVSTI